MALPPVVPSDTAAIVPQPGDPACTVLSNMVQGLTQWNAFVAWLINEDGSITQDAIDAIGVGGSNALAAPTGVSASEDRTTDVTITWNAVSDASSYVVYAGSTNDTSEHIAISGELTERSFVYTGAPIDVVQWFSVQSKASGRLSALSTPDRGVRVSSAAPSSVEFPYSSDDETYTVPAGKTTMEVFAFGGGGTGGVNTLTGFERQAGLYYKSGGGGASGAFMHVTGITVTPGETWVIRTGKKSDDGVGDTFIYRTSTSSGEYIRVEGGGDGASTKEKSETPFGSSAAAGTCPAYGTSTLPSGTVDTVGGDASVGGNSGSSATGGAALSVSGLSAGAGVDGTTSTTPTYGEGGYVKLVFT